MRSGRGIPFLVVALCVCGVAAGQAGQIIYVDGAAVGADDGSSWLDAYVYLQDALAEAAATAPPIEIRVAQGIYKPDQGVGITPCDPNAAFQLLNGVTLKGGYAGAGADDPDARDVEGHTTVLSGGSPCGYVVTGDLTDATAVVDGFTIGRSSLVDGMRIDAGSPTIRNCVFENSESCVDIDCGSPSFVDCRFFEYADNAVSAMDSNCVLTRCVFERQREFPPLWLAAIASRGGDLRLTDCTFTKHRRECIYVDGTLDLVRCSFVGVSSFLSDVVVYCFGPLTASDCVFLDNTVGRCIHVSGSLDLVRCSFVGNSGDARGIVGCSGPLTASDCAFLDNAGQVVSVWDDAELVDCRFADNLGTALFASGMTLKATRCVFSGNSHDEIRQGAAIQSGAPYMELSHCIFTGNYSPESGGGAINTCAQLARISHCTFAGNRGEPSTVNIGHQVEMTHCIVRDGPDPFATWLPDVAPPIMVTYSNVEGGWAGEGNIDVDPCFVDPGYWDANDTSDDPNDDVWVAGDYHLKSQAGHWDAESEDWVLDDMTSPCIDAGDPNGPINAEPFPNGGYANLGAYGGTAEASRSYFGESVCTTQIAGDINGDCKVDDLDMDILLSHWLMEDIGRINVPPTITIVSPQDGAEFSPPEPVVFQFETSDPDGRVIYVGYTIECRNGNAICSAGDGTGDPGESWVDERPWSRIYCDGVCVLRARAVDEHGAVTFAPEITITLHP